MTIYRVTDTQVLYGQTIQNVLHFKHFSSDPLTMQSLATDFEVNWVQVVKFRQSSSLKHISLTIRMIASQFAPFTWPLSVTGNEGATDQLILIHSEILRLRSAVIGRHGRGRIYIAGVNPNQSSNGFVTAARITNWNATIVTLMNRFGPTGASDFQLVIARKNAPETTEDVTSMQISPTTGCQRRRNSLVGI